MSSKSRGGLSKREYAVKQAGGTLNYKTGKISVPAKKVTYKAPAKISSKSSSSDPNGYFDPEAYTEDIYNALPSSHPAKVSAAQHPGGFAEEARKASESKKSSSSKSSSNKSSVNTSQRTTASKALNTLLGIPTANAASGATPQGTIMRPTGAGRFLQKLLDPTGMLKGTGLTSGIIGNLGMTSPAQEFKVGENLTPSQTEQAYAALAPESGMIETQRVVGGEPMDFWKQAQQEQSQNTARNFIPGYEPTNPTTQTSSRVSQPNLFPNAAISGLPVSSQLGDISNLAAQRPDFTPIAPENAAMQGLGGQGIFSRGQFGNGAGGYGVEGGLTGTNQGGVTWDDLNAGVEDFYNSIDRDLYAKDSEYRSVADQLMAEIDQSTQGLGGQIKNNLIALGGTPTSGSDVYSGLGSLLGLPNTMANQTGGGKVGKSNDVMKTYDSQEKSLKKALKEQQKQIEAQYGTDVATGTEAMNQAKQQDLLKLSGMFNFANSAPNDEQRIQYQTRTTNDYAGRLKELLTKLSEARNQSVSGAKQGYQSQLGTIQQARAQAQQQMQQLAQQQQQQQFENMLKMGNYGRSAQTQRASSIQDLLGRASQMPSGGREYAQQQANTMGLGNIGGYTPDNWEQAYNPNFGQQPQRNIISLGNGMILDKDTGDVYSAN